MFSRWGCGGGAGAGGDDGWADGADACGGDAAALGCSGVVVSVGVVVSGAVGPLAVRAGPWRFGLLGMWFVG